VKRNYNIELVGNYGKPTKKLQKVETQTLIKLWEVSVMVIKSFKFYKMS